MLKHEFKKFIYATPFVRFVLSLIYKIRGRKPFSLGYNPYKFSFIKKVIQEDGFSGEQLPFHYGNRLDERVVEYPWVINKIQDSDQRILDAGSSLNHPDIFSLSVWKEKELFIFTLDFEGEYQAPFKRVYSYGDLRKTPFPDNYFDSIISISTIEHIGMDNTFLYTQNSSKNEKQTKDYLLAIDEMKRILKPGGKLLITVPFGAYKDHGWFQVFDKNMINQIEERFKPATNQETYFKYENQQWNFSTAELCKNSIFYDVHENKKFSSSAPAASESVACLELVK